MIVIRSEQIEVLREPVLKQFEDEMVIHLQAAFAAEIEDMSEEELRATIRLGVKNAEKYDITISTDVSRFIEYMVCYGEDFDVSPELEWISETLNNNMFDGTEKMDEIDDLEREIILS